MTIQHRAGGRLTGLSTDTKPTALPDHYLFHETDTGDDFTLLEGVWIPKYAQSTIEASSVIADDAFIFSDGSTQSHAFDSAGIGWDIDTRLFKQSFSVTGEDSTPGGLSFKLDGTKMYIIGGDDRVYEYNLSVAWDISTAVIFQNILLTEDSITTDIFFRSDGLKMYITGRATGGFIYEYDLGTAWDVSTVVFLQSFDVSPPESNPLSIDFKPDGKTMYVVGNQSKKVNEFNLTIPWDISTASVGNSVDVSNEDTNPNAIWFKIDGTKMYLGGIDGDTFFQYGLSVPWDITTATVEKSFNPDIMKNTSGIYIRRDGLKLYTISLENDSIHEFDLGLQTEGQIFFRDNRKVSGRGVTTTDVYNLATDFPPLVNGAFNLPQGFCFFKNDMTFDNPIVIPAGIVASMIGEDTQNTTLTYTGTGAFIRIENSESYLMRDINVILTGNNAEFIDVTGADVFLEHMAITFSGTGTQKMGTISSSGMLAMDTVDFNKPNRGFTITTANDLRFNRVLVDTATVNPGTDILFDVLALTRVASFKNCIFDINSNESVFGFKDNITNPIIIDDSIMIGSGSFYKSGSFLDETDPPLTSTGNTGSPDSQIIGDAFLGTSITVTIVTINVPVVVAGVNWAGSALNQRFTVSTAGVLTYTGARDITLKIDGRIMMVKTLGGSDQVEASFEVAGVNDTDHFVGTDNNSATLVATATIAKLSTNDTVKLIVRNASTSGNIDVDKAIVIITEV